jgi:pSer/pThr/pTyr-binding forkhead associated (FHA) protein
MGAYLEVSEWGDSRVVMLEGTRYSVGRTGDNDLVLAADGEVSRRHALFEGVAGGWCLRDLSSKNGTFVNDERLGGDRPLRSGDQIRIGRTWLVFHAGVTGDDTVLTQAPERAPELTRRERDVLVALFAGATRGELFNEPASTREMAEALSISEAAVKQHLLHLYDKFGIHGEGERRRTRLANEALRRGAISLAEVQRGPG